MFLGIFNYESLETWKNREKNKYFLLKILITGVENKKKSIEFIIKFYNWRMSQNGDQICKTEFIGYYVEVTTSKLDLIQMKLEP